MTINESKCHIPQTAPVKLEKKWYERFQPNERWRTNKPVEERVGGSGYEQADGREAEHNH